ncbi:acyloxyacyl hydrolase [Occallatibacter savannae]|uniref:acyloxyacyl hydrolase n=1 Tax=Occallatibacter savannae TaxID=1002691 RepID=UPI000D68C905|nr:acyloxyacyl hydrolase [Occallatibacter savannae]
MRHFCLLFLTLLLLDPAIYAADSQRQPPPFQIYAGYSRLSNSFNGFPGQHKPLNGMYAGVAFPEWRHLRIKVDYSLYKGTNQGDPQNAFFIMAGGQYGGTWHRERFFVEALAGEGAVNGTWRSTANTNYKNGNTGTIASFAEFLGGGVDTPIGSHTAFRIEGGVQHSNFDALTPLPQSLPYHPAGLPDYFGRISAGVVWTPRLGPEIVANSQPAIHHPVESEVAVESLNSVGHIHLFSDEWFSYLNAGAVEYDRHSWGRVLGADVDYAGEVLPVIILREPSVTDVYGDRLAPGRKTVYGIGILPIGARVMWFSHGHVKPFYDIKAGMTGYTKKVFSKYASYQDFALDQDAGVQFRLSERVDLRTAFGFLHQSNGFVVPSNPGLDEMNWSAGLSYHLGRPVAVQ